jgi:hypothetical protein
MRPTLIPEMILGAPSSHLEGGVFDLAAGCSLVVYPERSVRRAGRLPAGVLEGLLLEQIIERLARIQRPGGRGRFLRDLRRLRVTSRRGVFFHGGAEFVKLAVIFRVLRGDALRNFLCAFKLRSGIKKPALFAAMQFRGALRARAGRIESGHQHRATIGAACPGHRAYHARRARAKLIGAPWSALRWFPIVGLFLLFFLFRVLITAVTVLSIHKRLRPPVSTDCNYICSDLLVDMHFTVVCIQSDCYTQPAGALIPRSFQTKLRWTKSRRWDIYVFSPLGVPCQAGL